MAADRNAGAIRGSGKGSSVTWQDELQHLDAELAAGRISAEDYRQRRDDVMRRAHAEQSGTPSGGFAQQTPGQQDPAGQNPFPPAFQWGGGAGGHPQGQPVQGQPPQAQPPQGQPVQGQPPQAQPPQAGSDSGDGDSNSTQVVNVNQLPPTASPPQGTPQQPHPPYGWTHQPPQAPAPQPWPDQAAWGPQQSWGTPDNQGTPWGDSDLPPEHGDTSWMRQGPEVFESAGGSSKGKVLGFTIAGALVVALIVVGVFFLLSSGGQTQQKAGGGTDQQQPPPPTPTTSKLPEPPATKPAPAKPGEVLIAAPDGPAHPFNGELTPELLSGARSGVLVDEVRKFALDNGMTTGWYRGTDGTKAPVATTLIAVKMPDEATASRLADTYLDAQRGLATIDELSYRGVQVKSTGDTFRTAYTSHSWTVVVDVRAKKGPGADARTLFQDLLTKQLEKMPPTVRK